MTGDGATERDPIVDDLLFAINLIRVIRDTRSGASMRSCPGVKMPILDTYLRRPADSDASGRTTHGIEDEIQSSKQPS